MAEHKTAKKLKEANERGAREAVIEQLFNDYNKHRFSVYRTNFVRGIFFGLGSVLGGTILVALLAWLLGQIGDIVPSVVADFIRSVVSAMQAR